MNSAQPVWAEGVRQVGSRMAQQFSKPAQSPRLHATRGWIRAFELASVGIWIVSASWSAVALSRAVLEAGPAAWLPLGVAWVFGWLLADALSGAVHYFADNFGAPSWPILGPALIASFRQHHNEPLSIVGHDIIERSGMLCFSAALLGGWVGPFLSWYEATPFRLSLGALGLSTAIWISWTGEFHAWAHGLPAPRVGKLLQRLGLVLSPTRHALHHAGSHCSHYCITSGVCDRLASWCKPPRKTPSQSPTMEPGIECLEVRCSED